ncbi:MAG: hypothetical protein CVU46_11060 [Chloroflexi bacterium HGW-Chloroflexi-8]|jgi:hypothetical protein|nr:MAG: hypothetical protein CVU46_11060 [Chloroflexi bacterium HGW-Chloroflexi-8]
MPLPVAYTEELLGQYMHSELGKVAEVLKLENPVGDAGAYQEAVNDVLLELGVQDIGSVSDLRKVRILAKLFAFQMAANKLAAVYDVSADGESYHRSQMVDHVHKAITSILSECMAIGMFGYSASIQTIEFLNDPYNYPKDMEV